MVNLNNKKWKKIFVLQRKEFGMIESWFCSLDSIIQPFKCNLSVKSWLKLFQDSDEKLDWHFLK